MKLFKPEFKEIPITLDSIKAELAALGGLKVKEIRTLVVFVTMVFLWLGGSNLEPYIGFKAPESFRRPIRLRPPCSSPACAF